MLTTDTNGRLPKLFGSLVPPPPPPHTHPHPSHPTPRAPLFFPQRDGASIHTHTRTWIQQHALSGQRHLNYALCYLRSGPLIGSGLFFEKALVAVGFSNIVMFHVRARIPLPPPPPHPTPGRPVCVRARARVCECVCVCACVRACLCMCLCVYPTSVPPFPTFSPSLISRTVSVDVKHHVHLLTYY